MKLPHWFCALGLLTAIACNPPDPDPVFCAVPLDGAPLRGNADAPVKMVEFADFECPYCRAVESTLRSLLQERPDDVALAFRHLPSGGHPHALAAALSGVCAQDQGLFWELHDAMIEPGAALDDNALLAYAAGVGLDTDLWQECRRSEDAYTRVETDLQMAAEANVTGTPTFFINGRALIGAQPLETFLESVDDAKAAVAASELSAEEYYADLQQQPCR